MEARSLSQNWVFNEDPWHGQEDQATRSYIVQGSDRIQRDPFGGEQDLDHDEPRSLESHSTQLENHAPCVESSFPVSGNGDSERDREHVEHGVGLEALLLEQNPDRIDGDGHEGFEHLDEGDGEVDVGGIREPERERVESSDGHDGG